MEEWNGADERDLVKILIKLALKPSVPRNETKSSCEAVQEENVGKLRVSVSSPASQPGVAGWVRSSETVVPKDIDGIQGWEIPGNGNDHAFDRTSYEKLKY